jgi:multisubunit Na+/H+ antiporter MnhG subunit
MEDVLIQSPLGTALYFLAYVLVVLGVLVMTVGVAYSMIRMSDVRMQLQLHAASKALLLGMVLLLTGTVVAARDPMIIWDVSIILRVVLVAAFALLTAPITARGFRCGASLRGKNK